MPKWKGESNYFEVLEWLQTEMKYPRQPFLSSFVPWRLLSILLLIDLVVITCYLTGLALLAHSARAQFTFSLPLIVSIGGPLLSGILCLPGSFRYLGRSGLARSTRQTRRFSPLLWAISGFVYATGQIIWSIQTLVAHQSAQYPSIAHLVQLLIYPCFIIAVLLLPARSISLIARLRILLDSLIIMTAITTLCYYFVLGPLLTGGDGTLQAKVVGGIYPILDLLAMFCVLMVALRSGERVLRPVLLMLGLAAVLQFGVNVLHLYEMLYRNYNEFTALSMLMIFYGTLLVGAAQTVNRILRKDEADKHLIVQRDDPMCPEARWKTALPSLLVLVFGLLVFVIWVNGNFSFSGQTTIVYIGGFVVLVLAILRQISTMYQISVLQERLQERNRSLDVLNAQLEKQATIDPLTDLPNHRALAEELDEVLERARVMMAPCSVIFMDIDHFKATNDCYGHLMGDAVLRHFVQVVTLTVRPGDLVGRWGGEEFVVILPETGPEEAFQIAEHIRAAVHQGVPACEGSAGLTCSSGVATYPQDANEREGLIRCADRAMYTAKRMGRNQTRIAHEPLVLAKKAAVPVAESGEDANMPEIAETLLALLKARDPSLAQHALRVAALSLALAQELRLGQSEVRMVRLGGLLHDLGDIAMPDEFLFKGGEPAEQEFESQYRYPVIGAMILTQVPVLRPVATIARAHCERVDGSGYPDRLKGEEIPLGARIVAVADAYDMVLNEQSSRRVRTSASALKELRRAAGSRLDPRVVEALARVIAISTRSSRVDVA